MRAKGETSSALRVLAERPYVRNLGLFVGLTALGSALVEYVLRVQAVAAFTDEAQLLSFFALFYTATSVISFAVQSLFGSLSLRRLGLAGSVALLPGALAFGGLMSFALPALWRAVFLRGVDMVLQNSLYRSGYELFYTPLSPSDKRATKSIIDIGFDRVGQVLGSGAILVIGLLAGDASEPWIIACVVTVAAMGLSMTVYLNRGYVIALGHSLQSTAVEIDGDALLDNTTRTVWESSVSMSRSRILAAIAEAEQWQGDEAASLPPVVDERDELLEAIADLRASDPEQVRRTLRRGPLDRRLVAHVIPLLGKDALVPEVLTALRQVAPQATGQLLDALLDVDEDFAVRRRLPRVLQVCTSQSAADGLMLALTDTRFNVRYHAARALLIIDGASAEVRLDPDRVFAAARREIEAGRHVWDHDRLIDADDAGAGPFDQILRERTSRSLEHVFTILALALDAEPLQLAFRALASDEPGVRGTALEYLDNVLPTEIRDALLPVLGSSAVVPTTHRSREQIVAELNRSVALDRAELRRKLGESEP